MDPPSEEAWKQTSESHHGHVSELRHISDASKMYIKVETIGIKLWISTWKEGKK
jgi:hypothetical protein